MLDALAHEVRLFVALLSRAAQVTSRRVQVLLRLVQVSGCLLQLATRVGKQLLYLTS